MWHKAALTIELKKRAAYVYDFWLKMIVPPLIQILVAYFLWDAVFSQTGSGEIGGYTFSQMMAYYVVAAFIYQMVQPEVGIVIMDIYDGTLTKYLFYPLSFIQFKFLAHLAQMILVGMQLVIAIFVAVFFFDALPLQISWTSVLMSVGAIGLAGYLFFIIAATLEILGFWVETVWGLVIMLQFVTNLLGGKMIPLSVFPEWAQMVITWSPFPALVGFPTQALLGELSLELYLFHLCIGGFWCIFFTLSAHMLWNRGSFQYTGTGM